MERQVPIAEVAEWLPGWDRVGDDLSVRPACGSLHGHACPFPIPYPTTHFSELSVIFFLAYSSVLPPRVLLNSGSFPTALQRNVSENLTR